MITEAIAPVCTVLEPPAAGPLAETLRAVAAHPELNRLEAAMAQLPQAEIPITHRFTPGLYIREMRMPAGCLATSKIHKTTHPFVISKGRVTVWTEMGGVIHASAPYIGITTPGTRRIIYAHEDCVWTTFHPTDKTTPEEVEADIIHPHHVPFPCVEAMEIFILNEEARQ